jgi:hypothetical protein
MQHTFNKLSLDEMRTNHYQKNQISQEPEEHKAVYEQIYKDYKKSYFSLD